MMDKIKQHKKMIIATFAALIIGVGFGRYLSPEKVEIKVEKVEIEKIVTVEKKVFVKQETKKTSKKKNTKTKKVTKPDGTIIEEKIETEEDVTFADNREKEGSETSKSNEKTKINKREKEVKYNSKRVRVSGLVGIKSPSSVPSEVFVQPNLMYGVHATYNFFGPVSIGMFGTSTDEFGISIGWEF